MVQWSFTNSIMQKHSMQFQLCYDSFKTFHIFIKNKNEIRFKTCFRESPCLSRMYFRNAVVHCKVVALSVSTVQNGTRRFSSSQQIRILRLEANTKGYHLNRWVKRKEKKILKGSLLTCTTSHGLWGLLFVCYKLCISILFMLYTSYLVFIELVTCFEIILFVYRVKINKDDHNETYKFSASNKPKTLTTWIAFSCT